MDNPVSIHRTQTPITAEGFALPLGTPDKGGAVSNGSVIRRLSPLERDRLMGWPDDYTRWGTYDDGETRELATTNRDRITGNGIVAPVVEWIARRIPASTVDRSTGRKGRVKR